MVKIQGVKVSRLEIHMEEIVKQSKIILALLFTCYLGLHVGLNYVEIKYVISMKGYCFDESFRIQVVNFMLGWFHGARDLNEGYSLRI